jgi:serine/tyrosine/threonine adenylyltransferase
MRLAQSLLPILQQEEGNEEAALASANEALALFGPQFEAAYRSGLHCKLGLLTEHEGDGVLAHDLLDRMAANHADFTLTFRRLCDAAANPEADATTRLLFTDPTAFDSWATAWHQRLKKESASEQELAAAMRKTNPTFIPRNHIVEAALDAAIERQDLQPFEELLNVVSRPYDDRPEMDRYVTPARPDQCVLQTFCGT